MARLVLPVAVVIALALVAGDALADRATKRRGKRADTVYVGEARVWSGAKGERVISRPALSKRRDAVAFAARAHDGALHVVVVLIGGDTHGHTMRFPVPGKARRPRGVVSVTWLGTTRVAFAPTDLRPTMIASWTMGTRSSR